MSLNRESTTGEMYALSINWIGNNLERATSTPKRETRLEEIINIEKI